MIDVMIVPLLVVEAACGVDACLTEPFGNLVELRAGHTADVVQAVTIGLVQYLHDVCGVRLAREVEVHLQQVVVGIVDFASGADHGQAVGFQTEVAEAYLQQIDAVETRTEEQDGKDDSSPAFDVQRMESQAEAKDEQHEVPEHVERHAAIDGGACRPCTSFRGSRMVVEGDAAAHQGTYQCRGMVAEVYNPYFLFARLQPQGQDTGTVNVGRAVAFGFGGMTLHEAESGNLFRRQLVALQEAQGALFFFGSRFHGSIGLGFTFYYLLAFSVRDS